MAHLNLFLWQFATPAYPRNVTVTRVHGHYSREYVIRQLDLAPDKSGDVRKLMGVIAADEESSAVLKKK